MTNSVGALRPYPNTVPNDLAGVRNVLQAITNIRLNDQILWTALCNQVGNAANIPSVAAYQSAVQTGIASSTMTQVNLQSVLWDTASGFNTTTSLYTVPLAGYYQINGSVALNTPPATGSNECIVTIYHNGAEALRGTDGNLTSHYTNVGVSGVLKCAVGDTVGLYVFQASGNSGALASNMPPMTRMDITLMRAL